MSQAPRVQAETRQPCELHGVRWQFSSGTATAAEIGTEPILLVSAGLHVTMNRFHTAWAEESETASSAILRASGTRFLSIRRD